MYYTGIGSRDTPILFKDIINKLSLFLEKHSYILRSGGAPGADTFFEEYISKKEIYLPWPHFNNNRSKLCNVSDDALIIAEQFHPNWNALSKAGKFLMGRNCYQVLGCDLNTPSKFIICYTKDGKASGGTGQAMRIAEYYDIPIINLFHDNWKDKLKYYLHE